jgi:hypothetical protein
MQELLSRLLSIQSTVAVVTCQPGRIPSSTRKRGTIQAYSQHVHGTHIEFTYKTSLRTLLLQRKIRYRGDVLSNCANLRTHEYTHQDKNGE